MKIWRDKIGAIESLRAATHEPSISGRHGRPIMLSRVMSADMMTRQPSQKSNERGNICTLLFVYVCHSELLYFIIYSLFHVGCRVKTDSRRLTWADILILCRPLFTVGLDFQLRTQCLVWAKIGFMVSVSCRIGVSATSFKDSLIIPAKAFARDYVITGVGLSVCLFVCLFVCYHDN